MIIAAAIKFGDLVCFVPKPGRHHNVLHNLVYNYGTGHRTAVSYEQEIQGFLTDKGEFLNRRDGLTYARERGQVIRPDVGGYQGDELFSEDLW